MYSSKVLFFVAALFSVGSLAAPVVVPGVGFSERNTIAPLTERDPQATWHGKGVAGKREAEASPQATWHGKGVSGKREAEASPQATWHGKGVSGKREAEANPQATWHGKGVAGKA
ncbi:hypothetical protein Vi05172_g11275 [Venturia inaequalis]|uniref:Uncharacterized protein n=1 Tax=Venturia inaequalis TaxID=5025 RepID=A0A8H3ZJ42_VENIN|nr:hypothetical protein EG327_003523 [Venturia inaequalis]RDI78674.1 hypothetical protein Vi05172_g11275 [Venturia inaequalis]